MYMSASAPEAPPFNETTIGCFIRLFFCTAAWIMRAIWSEAPPAPAATTISTGLVGSHADAGAEVKRLSRLAPRAGATILFIWFLPFYCRLLCGFAAPVQGRKRLFASTWAT